MPVSAIAFLITLSIAPRVQVLTPEAVVTTINTLAETIIYVAGGDTEEGKKYRSRLSSELVRLNSCSESTVKRACKLLEEPGPKPLEEPVVEKAYICHLWFLLRYRPTRPSDRTDRELYFKYHFNFVEPWQILGPDFGGELYDYPWIRKDGAWQIQRFSLRFGGAIPSPTFLYEKFCKLPLRGGIGTSGFLKHPSTLGWHEVANLSFDSNLELERIYALLRRLDIEFEIDSSAHKFDVFVMKSDADQARQLISRDAISGGYGITIRESTGKERKILELAEAYKTWNFRLPLDDNAGKQPKGLPPWIGKIIDQTKDFYGGKGIVITRFRIRELSICQPKRKADKGYKVLVYLRHPGNSEDFIYTVGVLDGGRRFI